VDQGLSLFFGRRKNAVLQLASGACTAEKIVGQDEALQTLLISITCFCAGPAFSRTPGNRFSGAPPVQKTRTVEAAPRFLVGDTER